MNMHMNAPLKPMGCTILYTYMHTYLYAYIYRCICVYKSKRWAFAMAAVGQEKPILRRTHIKTVLFLFLCIHLHISVLPARYFPLPLVCRWPPWVRPVAPADKTNDDCNKIKKVRRSGSRRLQLIHRSAPAAWQSSLSLVTLTFWPRAVVVCVW